MRTRCANGGEIVRRRRPGKMRFAMIIPAYKAAGTLPSVLQRVPNEFWNEGFAVIVNDGSPDDTGVVAGDLATKYPAVDVIHHESNRGYGGALKTGLRHALAKGAEASVII